MIGFIGFFIGIRLNGGEGIGPWQFRAVLSESMQETYPVGSLLVTKQVPIKDIKEVDVLSMQIGETVLSHRIVHKFRQEDDYVFQTKGDSNTKKDPFVVKENQILGKVVLGIPSLGKFLLKLQTANGKIAFFLLLIELYLLQTFIKLIWS